jgi:formylglycine-generating enzyme
MNARLSPVRRAALGALKLAAVSLVPFLLRHDQLGGRIESEELLRPLAPSRPWVLVSGRFWQIESASSEDAALTDAAEGTRGQCAPGMVEVQGSMKVDSANGNVELLQDSTCTDWIDRDFPARCAAFDMDKWRGIARDLPTAPMHFCIDRFEYPNRKGAYPIIAVTFYEAEAVCAARQERLCTEDEWTFACEGEEARPYPYGYARDPKACVIDRPWKLFDEERLAVRDSALAIAEIDYVWQGEASGAYGDCRSPFGVYDMTGNVDEWTRSVQPEGYRSIFKGGYWGPVRARCRAATRAHNEDFYFYQQGLRCCSDVPPADQDSSTDLAR